MTISDITVVAAVLVAPILAVQVQKWIENINSKKNRKLHIFKALMANRGALYNPILVEALNRIDLEYKEKNKKDKMVLEAWQEYLDHLAQSPLTTDPDYSSELKKWNEKREELFIGLLYEMSKTFKYNFTKIKLKRGIYTPQGQVDLENDQLLLRKFLLEVVSGRLPLPIKIYEGKPKDEEVLETLKKI